MYWASVLKAMGGFHELMSQSQPCVWSASELAAPSSLCHDDHHICLSNITDSDLLERCDVEIHHPDITIPKPFRPASINWSSLKILLLTSASYIYLSSRSCCWFTNAVVFILPPSHSKLPTLSNYPKPSPALQLTETSSLFQIWSLSDPYFWLLLLQLSSC